MGFQWKTGLKDLLFPPLCIACREPGGSTGFCANCWSQIAFLDGPLCKRCGIPFDVPLHRLRLWRRRYNQTAELARAVLS